MIQYNTLNVKLCNSQLNKLKSRIKNGTEVTLNLLSNVICNSNDEHNFPYQLLLPNTQFSRLRKAFTNNSSTNMKLSKTQLHKIETSVGFLGRLLGPLLKTGLPLMKKVLKSLAKSVSKPLGFTAAVSSTDSAIQKKIFGSGMKALINSNEEMDDMMKIIESLEESGLLIKGISGTIRNEAKAQKGGVLRMLLGILVTSLLGLLMLPHPLTNFEIQKYYQNESKFSSVYSRNNLPKIKNGAYAINLEEYKSVGTHWIALYVNDDNGSTSYDVSWAHSKRNQKIHRKQKYHKKYL